MGGNYAKHRPYKGSFENSCFYYCLYIHWLRTRSYPSSILICPSFLKFRVPFLNSISSFAVGLVPVPLDKGFRYLTKTLGGAYDKECNPLCLSVSFTACMRMRAADRQWQP